MLIIRYYERVHVIKDQFIYLISDEDEITSPKKWRRIISSDSDSDQENIPPSNQKTIASSLLEKIGHVSKGENTFLLHEDIKAIWEEVLKRGLDKDSKDSIIKKTPSIKGCFTAAPTLNPEIKITLSSHAVKRDERLCEKQSQIGVILCGLSELLQEMLEGKNFDETIVERLSNYIRLLCDVHHMESQTRRAVILPGLNKNIKETLEKTDINNNLFGKNLSDIIREARTLEKSKKDLVKRPLNDWGPSGVTKQGGPLTYKRPYHQPPTKQAASNRQRPQLQQFRTVKRRNDLGRTKDKEISRRAPTDSRRRRD